jgi:hypothetical protein
MMERGCVTCRGYFGRGGFFGKSEWQGEKAICLSSHEITDTM